ncbi:hypothetical protein QNN00_10540 [Bacillus velezensis]|nr:hypothetical protein [Bacillus velezensis]
MKSNAVWRTSKFLLLCLQILVENALRHAFSRKQDSCAVNVSVVSAGQSVLMRVGDNGRELIRNCCPCSETVRSV